MHLRVKDNPNISSVNKIRIVVLRHKESIYGLLAKKKKFVQIS